MTQKLSFKEKISQLKAGDEQFVYFMAFLYALSTGDLRTVELIKTGGSSGYGRYSDTFKDVYRLGVGWGYGLAKSCEMLALKISKEDHLRNFLVKMAQVIRLGDELQDFLKLELGATIHSFSSIYERKLEAQKLFLEIFYTLMSTTAVMVAANSLLTMLASGADSEMILVVSLTAVIIGMATFVFILYMLFPRDGLMVSNYAKANEFRTICVVSVSLAISLGMVFFLLDIIPPVLIVAVAALPLFIPGFYARKLESRTNKLNESYPSLIRHFGQIYSTVGSVGQTLDAVLKSDFGILGKHLHALNNRVKNRINPEMALELFSKETGSVLISSGNIIIAKTITKGANMNEVGNKIAEITATLNAAKAKRLQISKTFQLVVIISHVLTLSIFGLMNKISQLFHVLLSGLDTKNTILQLTPVDPNFLYALMPILILSMSIINGFAIKVAEGGLYKTVWYYIALLSLLGAVVMQGTIMFLTEFLDKYLLDIH